MSLNGALVAFCNPLLDITASVPDDLLQRYGLEANNAILAGEQHLPLYEELVKGHQVLYTAGGSAQNTMRAAQWMLPAGSTVFVGCVGCDANGETLRRVATEDGLQTEYMEDEETPTGVCAVLVTQQGKCRSLVANLGAANKYSAEHARSARLQRVLGGAKCIYISGFFLTVSPETALEVAKKAHQQGKIVCLNLSAPFICQFFAKPLLQLIPHVDYLFGNEAEARALAKALDLPEDASERAVAVHVAQMAKTDGLAQRRVIFTQGAHPTIVATGAEAELFPVEELPAEAIVDTNGAGDAFAGGFLAQLIQGRSVASAVRAGHYAASVIIRTAGVVFPAQPAAIEFNDRE